MKKRFCKKIFSAVILVCMLVSHFPVLADDPVKDILEEEMVMEPTPVPLCDEAEVFWSETQKSNVIESEESKINYSYPEAADRNLIDQVDNIELPEDSNEFDLFNVKFMKKYISDLLLGNEEAVLMLNEYYTKYYGDIDNVDTFIDSYFTEDEVRKQIFSLHYKNNDNMKMLLVCFIEDGGILRELKEDILNMIKSGYTIPDALRVYVECRDIYGERLEDIYYESESLDDYSLKDQNYEKDIIRNDNSIKFDTNANGLKKEDEKVDITIIDENNEEIKDLKEDVDIKIESDNKLLLVAQENNIIKSSALSEFANKEEIWKDEMLSDKHFQSIEGNISVDEKLGGLTYTRNDVSIPLRNGMIMDLPIYYNSKNAYARSFGCEYTNISDIVSIYYDVEEKYSPLGLGWDFAVTEMRDGIITLSDGRTLSIDERTKTMTEVSSNKYPDIKFEYDDELNKYYIQYLNGTKEYFDKLNFDKTFCYISKKVDKYGNEIIYKCDRNDPSKLTKVYSGYDPNLAINIIYNDSETILVRPDGSKVTYDKEKITLTYGKNYSGELRTAEADVLSFISDDSVYYDTVAYFDYTSFDSQYLFEVVSGYLSSGEAIYSYDSRVYALLSLTEDCISRNTLKYTYTQLPQYHWANYPGLKTIERNGAILKDYDYDFEWNLYYPTDESVTTCITNDGVKTETQFDVENDSSGINDIKQISTVSLNKSNKYYIKQYNECLYPKDKPHTPYYNLTKLYNNKGNFISRRYDYEYNGKDQLTKIFENVDGIEKNKIINTYSSNKYSSLLSTTKENSIGESLYSCSYRLNDYGDVEYEYIEGNGTILDNIYYYDSNHNLIGFETSGTHGNNYYTQYEYGNEYNNAVPTRVFVSENGKIIYNKNIEYDPLSNLKTAETDGRNNTENYLYDSYGRLIEQTHPDGSKRIYDYCGMDGTIWAIDENEYQIEYKYSNGNISWVKESKYYDGSVPQKTLRSNEIDILGRITKTEDAEGNETLIEYDQLGRQIKITSPEIDGQASVTEIKYFDVFLEGTAKYSMSMIISPEGKVSCKYYDIFGRLLKTAVIVNPEQLLSYNLDNLVQMPGDIKMVTTSMMYYNDLDQVITKKDGENRCINYTYDIFGNILSMSQGSGAEELYTEYKYDAYKNIIEISQGRTDPHVTTYEYDHAGRLVKETDPMGYTEEYTYDTAGNLTGHKDKNGVWTTNIYDSRNRLVLTGKGTKSISYTYDPAGNILTAADENGTISYEYNLDGTLKKKTMPDGKSMSYNSYDDNKKLKKMTDYFGNITDYTYDARGNVASIAETYSGKSEAKTTTYEYNQDNTLKKVNIPNNMWTEYTYDYAGRVTYLKNSSIYLERNTTHSYTYDNAGNITKAIEKITYKDTVTTSYTYDSANRLKKESSPDNNFEYTYDEYNNIVSVIGNYDKYYSYDANNRLTGLEDLWISHQTDEGEKLADWHTSYWYDKNGNLLESDTYSTYSPDGRFYNSECKEYEYDDWGRLVNYSARLGKDASYTYYADGLRRSRELDNKIFMYYYNGDKVINETKNGEEFATNVDGVNGYISRQYNNYEHYYFKNLHGDVVFALTNGPWDSGQYSYDAYGDATFVYDRMPEIYPSTGEVNPIRYSGEYYDEESNMVYLRARYYDIESRRFISEDPAKDGVNWYVYCGNSPVIRVDPTGLNSVIFKETSLSSTTWVFGNMEEKDTGYYCNLRSLTAYAGAELSWRETENGGGAATIGFNNGDDYYQIVVDFDSVVVGEYSSNVRVYKNSLEVVDAQVGNEDRVVQALNTGNAYFFISAGDQNDGSLRVQAKVSTMLYIFEKGELVDEICAPYEISKLVNDKYPEIDIQDTLDFLGTEPLYTINYDMWTPSYIDALAEAVMGSQGGYQFY